MNGRSRSNKGISAIIGVIVAVGIIVTVVVPLFLFGENIVSIREQYVAKRHSTDKERMDESLASQAYIDFFSGTQEIRLRLHNIGYLAVKVLRIYVMPRDAGYVPPKEVSISLAPRSDMWDQGTGEIAEPGRIYDIKFVTERGNIYVPDGSPLLGGEQGYYPYTLSVTIINMRVGYEYTLDLTSETNPPPVYFPVHMEWKATSSNTYQTLAFGVNMGIYWVTISDNKGWTYEQRVVVGLASDPSPAVCVDAGGEVPPGQGGGQSEQPPGQGGETPGQGTG